MDFISFLIKSIWMVMKMKLDEIWYNQIDFLSILSVPQMASYFGYSVAVTDLNGDGYVENCPVTLNTLTPSLSFSEHWTYNLCPLQDWRCAGWSSPLHGERDREQTQGGGKGVPVPADGPAHFLPSCRPHRHIHLWPLRHGYSTSGRHQPGRIQWYAESMKDWGRKDEIKRKLS